MSERPISVGDLVMVVKPMRCGCDGALGSVFVVRRIVIEDMSGIHCKSDGGCGRLTFPPDTLVAVHPEGDVTELGRVIRIPPPSEIVGVRTEEKLREPA